ncbi:MAG TPA: protein kinase [Bryobacteraceae bacterium]|nr:protein kinase [Bryobacteraceae bacterium]
MPLSAGDKLGPYEILASLGSGGMGEVYRARDAKLNRDVAIKVLPAGLAGDAQYMARFEREAQMLAAQNHPNIATVYGIEQGALVMELVEGADLKGPLPLEEALGIARQIAAGLEAAHEKGIIHRDLKPANIKLTPAGVVKILDFGLAKSADDSSAAPGSNPTLSPTLSLEMTRAGMILGTAAYMSPEQARGKQVDRRTDIWAFGVVLYEIVTGKRLFEGEDFTETLASVVKEKPDLSGVPAHVRRLLERCLEKDPKKRLRDIGDMELLLAEGADEGVRRGPGGPPHRWPWIAAAGVLAVAAAGLGFVAYRATRPAELKPLVRLDVDLGADVSLLPLTNGGIPGSSVAISPDGTRLVYVSGAGTSAKLFTRRLDQSKATELPGAEGVAPFFSADSQWIGFETGSFKLNKISVEGGAVVPLGDFSGGGGASWGEDGNIFLGVREKGLVRIRDGGGAPETIAPVVKGEAALTSPQILPGGKAILFSAYTAPNPNASSIEVMTLADHHRKTVSRGGTSPHYLATSNGAGYLVYLNKATLFAIPFDLDKLETRGTALPILDDVASSGLFGTAQLSISRTGTLVYRKSGGGEAGLLTVAWLDNAGKAQPLLAKPGVYGRPSLSPDGQRLALEVTEGSGTDIWIYDWQRDTMTRLTFTGTALGPVWSPDGRYIAFRVVGEGMSVTRSDGAGKPQSLTQSKSAQWPWSFTADGKRMAFAEQDLKTSFDVWTVPIESDGAGLRAGKPEVFLQTPAVEHYPALSPDGRWLAYSSDESGTRQIYVRAFPDKGGKWQISNSGGVYPMWLRGDLFFESPDQHIMAAAYSVKGDSFVPGKPRLWCEKPIGGTAGSNKNLDLAPDGKRIVALMPATEPKGAQEAQNHVVFLMNFFDELRRKVPAGK